MGTCFSWYQGLQAVLMGNSSALKLYLVASTGTLPSVSPLSHHRTKATVKWTIYHASENNKKSHKYITKAKETVYIYSGYLHNRQPNFILYFSEV